MNVPIVGIGLFMVLSAGVLAGLGHYDGVLGSSDPTTYLATDGGPGTFRVVVTGSSEDAASTFVTFRQQLLLPKPMQDEMVQGQFVPIRFEDSKEPVTGFLAVRSWVPEPGQALVVSGHVETQWPVLNQGSSSLPSVPVLFVHADDYHAPILFKR